MLAGVRFRVSLGSMSVPKPESEVSGNTECNGDRNRQSQLDRRVRLGFVTHVVILAAEHCTPDHFRDSVSAERFAKPTRDVGFSHRRSEGVQPVRKWIAQYTVKMTAKKNAIEKSRSAIAFIILILPLQDNQPRSLHWLSKTELCNLSTLIFGNTTSGLVCSARLLSHHAISIFCRRHAEPSAGDLTAQ